MMPIPEPCSWRGRTRLALALVLLLAAAGRAEGVETNVHALLDLVATGNAEAIQLNSLYRGDTSFDAYRLRVLVDGTVTDRLRVYTDLLFGETSGARAFGAYVVADPWKGRDFHLVGGEMPWLIGSFAPRSYSDRNPLIGNPMMYQFHTTLRPDQVVVAPGDMLAQAGSGNDGVNYAAGGRASRGMPVIYDQWWDFGVGVMGSSRPLEFAAGIINGTPGFTEPARDENAGKAVLGRLGLAPTPGTRFGISGAYGPYLANDAAGALPGGRRPEDYNQVLAMADAEWSAGHLSLCAEAYRNVWETPWLGDLRVSGGYVEGKFTLPAGFYLASRYEIMRFSDLVDSTGAARPWDSNWDRSEMGVGYRVARGALAKLVYQLNLERRDEAGEESERYGLVAAQLSVRF